MEKLLSYDRLISYHRNRLDVPAFPKTEINIAYEKEKYNDFKHHLKNSNDNLKIKTINEINNYLQNGEEVFKYAVLNTDIVFIIFNLLKENANVQIRISCSYCFVQFCKLDFSIKKLYELEITKKLESVLQDKNQEVRLNVIKGLIYYVEYSENKDILLLDGVYELVINRINKEDCELILFYLLNFSFEILKCKHSANTALKNNIINILKKHLNSNKIRIRCSIYMNLASISIIEEGKIACTNEGSLIKDCISQLSEMNDILKESVNFKQNKFDIFIYKEDKNNEKYQLQDIIDFVVQLTRFLLSVSILKRGKEEIFKYNGLQLALSLINKFRESYDILNNDDKEQVLINCLQYLGNTSEDPNSKKYMIQNINDINKCNNIDKYSYYIQNAAEEALKVINWKP